MNTDDRLTVKEAAEELGEKYHTVLARIHRMNIPVKRFGGWAITITRAELETIRKG